MRLYFFFFFLEGGLLGMNGLIDLPWILLQESRESQVSSTAAVDNQAPLFSDRTDETDKTITRYGPTINEDVLQIILINM